MNPIVPIAGAVILFFLFGKKKGKSEEEMPGDDFFDEPDDDEVIGGGGGGVGGGYGTGSGYDGSGVPSGGAGGEGGEGGGFGPIVGMTAGTWQGAGGGTGGAGEGFGPIVGKGIKKTFPGARGGTTEAAITGIKAGTWQGAGGGTTEAAITGIKAGTWQGTDPSPGEDAPSVADESTPEDVDESVERQEEIEDQKKKDKNVLMCQSALFALGAGRAPSGQWGYYNSATKKHLEDFQANHGLRQTGLCDIDTKRKLDSEISRRSRPDFCFGPDACYALAEKALHMRTGLYVALKTDSSGRTTEGALYRVGPNAKVYYEAYEATVGISPVLTGAWPFEKLPWAARYSVEKAIDRSGGDTWEVGKAIEGQIFAGRIPGPGEKFGI